MWVDFSSYVDWKSTASSEDNHIFHHTVLLLLLVNQDCCYLQRFFFFSKKTSNTCGLRRYKPYQHTQEGNGLAMRARSAFWSNFKSVVFRFVVFLREKIIIIEQQKIDDQMSRVKWGTIDNHNKISSDNNAIASNNYGMYIACEETIRPFK